MVQYVSFGKGDPEVHFFNAISCSSFQRCINHWKVFGHVWGILADQSLCNKRGSGKRWIRNFVTYVRLVHIQSWTSSEGHFWKTSSEKPSEGSCIFRAERGRSLYKPNSDFKVVGIGVKGGGGRVLGRGDTLETLRQYDAYIGDSFHRSPLFSVHVCN